MGEGWAQVPAPPAPAPSGRRRRRRWVIAGALAGVVVLLGLGAGVAWLLSLEVYLHDEWRVANSEAVRGAGPAPAYVGHDCPFRTGEAEVACGTLLVPLDRDHPDAGTIELAVARIAATGPDVAADPVIYLEGGPGGFAVADYWWWLEEMGHLLERRDVILLDQRGVGYSDPALTCPEFWEDTGEDDPYAHEVKAARDCHDRLVGEGHGLAAYSTPAIAADVADLRAALGLESVNLFGVSYGTRVALAVLRDHPEGVRSVVLDSVFPLEVRALDEQVLHAAAAIELVLDRCAADDRCAARHPDLTAKLDAAVEALNDAPARVRMGPVPLIDSEELTGDDLVHLVFDALYVSGALERVPAAIDAAAAGDMATAVELLDGGAEPPARREWADEDSDGLFYSVTCREDAPVSDPALVARNAEQVRSSLAAALLADVETTLAVCDFWDAGTIDPGEAEPVRSAVPALVLAGAYDPITPPVWAQQVDDVLEASVYVEFGGLGHAVVAGGACPVGIITAFLDAPRRAPDVACARR